MKAWLGNLHMTKKLLVSPFMALLFLLIFGVVSYFAFFKQQSALDDIYKNRFKRCLSTAATIVDLKEVHTKMQEIMTAAVAAAQDSSKETTEKDASGAAASEMTARQTVGTSINMLYSPVQESSRWWNR